MYDKESLPIDSYDEFLKYFSIDKQAFYDWGLASTIFPDTSSVALEWNSLKSRIFSNQSVRIRGYGRGAHATQLYLDLYKELFGNNNVKQDPTNNFRPQQLMQQLTGLKRNTNIFNYQVSHIWGHTKNIFMFEAPWNICYTPKIMDPFTGHETKGMWPVEYQQLFIQKAYELYKPFVDEYNQLLVDLHLEKRIQEYFITLEKIISSNELDQFFRDVTIELSPIAIPANS